MRAFEGEGVACLKPKSSVPKARPPELDTAKWEPLRAWRHAAPRQFGKGRSLWTLHLVAAVWFEQGLTKALVSDETIREALRRLGVKWQRARAWITSPAPQSARKKRRETA
jgi:transposase